MCGLVVRPEMLCLQTRLPLLPKASGPKTILKKDMNPPRYNTCDSHRIWLTQRLLNPSHSSAFPLQSLSKLVFLSLKTIGRSFRIFISFRTYTRILFSYFYMTSTPLSDFIEFDKIPQKYLNSPWIWPLFTTMLSSLWLFLKIGEFRIFYDTYSCIFIDRTDSSCQPPPFYCLT